DATPRIEPFHQQLNVARRQPVRVQEMAADDGAVLLVRQLPVELELTITPRRDVAATGARRERQEGQQEEDPAMSHASTVHQLAFARVRMKPVCGDRRRLPPRTCCSASRAVIERRGRWPVSRW